MNICGDEVKQYIGLNYKSSFRVIDESRFLWVMSVIAPSLKILFVKHSNMAVTYNSIDRSIREY